MSQPTFYYPVTIVQSGGSTSANAPLLPTLPLDSVTLAAILGQPAGEQPQGLYVDDGQQWRFALPYIPLCAAGIFAQSITIYADPTSSATAPDGSTVYKNGILQGGLSITAGHAIYVVLTPPASGGGGGSYVLPAATNLTLGGIKVGAGLSVAIDGTLSVTSGGTTTLTGDVTGSGNGTVSTSLSTTGVTAGTYTKVTVDTKGRVSVGAQLAGSDVTTALGYTPYNGSTNPNGFLTTNQSIAVTGDATGTGSTAITLALANSGVTAGTYTKVTVDAKGRVTVGAALASSDVTTALGYTPYNGSTNPNGFLTTNQSITVSGDATGTGSTAITLALANSGVTAGTYHSVTVDAKGRVTAGTNPTTLSGYGITDGLSNAGGTMTGNLTLSGGATVTGLPTPNASGDATNKSYVDAAVAAVAQGASWKANAQVASTANLTLSGTQTIDGYAAQVGDRVLVKDQTTASQNGVYVVASGAWTRAVDADLGSEIKGMAILVINGTTNALSQWVNTNTAAPNIGTDAITYTMLQSSGSTYSAGTGLTLSSNQFSITNTGVTAGTYTKVTVNAQGQVTAGTSLTGSDVNTALGYTAYNGSTNPNGFLTANQNITVSGDATGSGTTAVTLTLANSGVTAGTYTKVTVDAKGRVTVGAALASSDVTTALGYTPYNGTTNPSGFLTANQSITLSGDATGSGSTAITVALANSGVTAGTYTKVTVDAKGRVTVGASLASSDVTTALGYTPLNKAGDTLNGALNWASTVSITAASTTDIGGAASNSITVTGNTTITALGTASAGAERWVTFSGTPILTHNATSLILPTSANITAAAGDSAVFMSLGGGNWRCIGYARADGTALAGSPDATKLPLTGGTLSGALNLAPVATLASASTVNIGAAAANDISITGTTTITAFDTIASGAHRNLIFAGALTLTHNGTSLILPGAANITTAAGDVAQFVSLGSGNWRCTGYMKADGTLIANSLTNTTLVNPTITNFTESGQNPAAGSSFTVNLANGTDFEFTTNANTTITLPTPVAGKSYTITVIYGGAHTVSFAGGGTIKYSGGSAPTATSVAGQRDYYLCKCDRTGTYTSVFDGGRNF
jgi:phage-related tail fiber protein